MTRVFTAYDQLAAAAGEVFGPSDWVAIGQDRIDTFADATGDHQWIHVDAERAARGPFGGTVAHGYLTLSLVPTLVATLVQYTGWPLRINYGLNKVRFPQPVTVDSRVRAKVQLLSVTKAAAGTAVTSVVTMDAEDPSGQRLPKPALVAETVTLLA